LLSDQVKTLITENENNTNKILVFESSISMKEEELRGEKDKKSKVLKKLTSLEQELNLSKSESISKVVEIKNE